MSSILRSMLERVRIGRSHSPSPLGPPDFDAWLERAIVEHEAASKVERMENRLKAAKLEAQKTARGAPKCPSTPTPPGEKRKASRRLSL